MRKVITCRRTVIAAMGMACCVAISYGVKVDTSGAIAMICLGVAGANAAQATLSVRSVANNSRKKDE